MRAIKRRCVCLLVRELAVPRAAGGKRKQNAGRKDRQRGRGDAGTVPELEALHDEGQVARLPFFTVKSAP